MVFIITYRLLRFLNVYVIHTANIDSYILIEIRDNDVFFDYILMLIHFVFGVILIFSDGKEEINFCLRWTHFFKLKTCEFFTHKMRFIFIETQVQENRFHVYLARNIGFPKKCDLFKTLANPTIGYTSCIKIIYPYNIVLNLPFGVIYYGLWGGWYLEKAFTINIPVVPGKVEAINWMVIEYSIRDHLAFLQTVIVEGHIEMN